MRRRVIQSATCHVAHRSRLAQSGASGINNWYAPHGNPSPNIDLSGPVTAIPEGFSYHGAVYNLNSTVSALESEQSSFGGDNTIPWAFYSCLELRFPVTTVFVSGTPSEPNYPGVGLRP